MSLVTSLVTKQNFWILFPKITVGDIPEMLSIKVKHSDLNLTVLLENNRHFTDMLTDLTFHNDYGVFIIVNNGAGEDDLLFGASHWCPIDIGDIKTESDLEKL